MSLQILWTHIALQSLAEVFNYTYEEFGERQLHKLVCLIHSTTSRLAIFPQSGKYESANNELISKALAIGLQELKDKGEI